MKKLRIRWAEHVAHIGGDEKLIQILVGKFHSPLCNVDIKNEWTYLTASPYVFIAQCLITHKGQLLSLLIRWPFTKTCKHYLVQFIRENCAIYVNLHVSDNWENLLSLTVYLAREILVADSQYSIQHQISHLLSSSDSSLLWLLRNETKYFCRSVRQMPVSWTLVWMLVTRIAVSAHKATHDCSSTPQRAGWGSWISRAAAVHIWTQVAKHMKTSFWQ
jgi:hypothetical protein